MKVLVVKMSSLGDVIHTLPALGDAVQALPGIRFDWVVEEAFAEIPGWHPAVDQVIPVAIRRWRKRPFSSASRRQWREARQRLAATSYDAVIDAQGLLKSALLTRLVAGPRFGLDSSTAREGLAARAYDHPVHVPRDMHAVERTRALFALALGYPLRATTGDYGLRDSFPATAAELPPGLLFFHGTARDEKLWPEAHWVELAALAAESGYRVWLPWGNAKERDRAQRIAAGSVAAEVLPALSLRELAGMLCQVAGAVAVDTGLGHLAAALDVPTVSLYGPTSTKLIGAYGRNQLHLESPLTHASGSDAHARMAAISAPSVWQALGELLPLAGKPTGPLAGQGS